MHLEEVREGTFGQVTCGEIRGTGLLQQIDIDYLESSTTDRSDQMRCSVVEGVVGEVLVDCVLDEDRGSGDSPLTCWCLRVGVHNCDGRSTVSFLLLEPTYLSRNEFRRIRTAETAVWGHSRAGALELTFFSTDIGWPLR
ncbi:hypothetical protein GJ744_000919 [Endocarpon pusillum]|uniref:Uncharacterized protein n=1 Tax=Endocarpon pusillum TaxID=364733 RepID=A0A8H7AP54_9EURO|nr:hypothetical protein GJ744_000919 [Endocarpon pusillum]